MALVDADTLCERAALYHKLDSFSVFRLGWARVLFHLLTHYRKPTAPAPGLGSWLTAEQLWALMKLFVNVDGPEE